MNTWLTHHQEKGLPQSKIDQKKLKSDFKASIKANKKKAKAGIYLIENKKLNKYYIGRSTNHPDRIRQHKYVLNTNTCTMSDMQTDWNNHKEHFVFSVLEVADPKDLNRLEKEWIQKYINEEKDMYNRVFVVKDKTLINIKREHESCIKKVIDILDKQLITPYDLIKQLELL